MSLSGVLYRRFLRLAKTIEQNPSLKSFFTKSPVSYYNRETSEWMGFESTDITQAGTDMTKELAWKHFLKTIRENLRIVVNLSTMGKRFQNICIKYPSLIANLEMIRLSHWNQTWHG